MALQDAVVGATRTGQRVTWLRTDGTRQDLTGATITARIRNVRTGQIVTSNGTFTPVAPFTDGVFDWAYGSTDIAPPGGLYTVQFKAAYSGGAYDQSFEQAWNVRAAI